MIDFTVAIPTFNGAQRLPLVLDRLKQQQGVDRLKWEVIVMDNNSTDDPLRVVQSYQSNFPCPLLYYFEKKQGLAFARKQIIEQANGNWVGFLDDDNLPEPFWVLEAWKFANTHPRSGAFGGQIHGDYEVTPPPNFKRIACFLAIVEPGKSSFKYDPKTRMLPPGAGLVVNREAWLAHVPKQQFLRGITKFPRSILSGEDLEAILSIQKGGWEIWHNNEMVIYHKIPAIRLTREKLLITMRGTGLARHYIRMLRFKLWQRPFLLPCAWLNDVLKAVRFFLKHRHCLKTDDVLACEMEFLRTTVISPFYLLMYLWWKRQS